MATRYWVGGTGAWDASTTANWSATSGGAGGASAPTSADDAVFDQAATYTINMGSGAVCRDITVSAGTPSFSSVGDLSVWGSMTLNATTAWTPFGTVTFRSTTTGKTINTAGISMGCSFIFDGVGGGWSLLSNFVMNQAGANFALTNGSFSMNGFNLTVMNFTSTGSTARTLIMSGGTLTANYTTISINMTNLTLSVGTSTLSLAAASAGSVSLTVTGGTGAFYNIVCGTKANSLTGTISCNNFTVSASTGGGLHDVTLNGSITVTGSVSMNGGDAQNPTYFHGPNASAIATITAAAWPSPADIVFAFATVAGVVAPLTVTRGGDAGSNSGITFPASKTVYWNNTSALAWWSTSFATTAAGAPAINNQPLPQDNVIVGAAGSGVPATTVTWSSGHCNNLDFSALSSALSLTMNSMSIFGDMTLSANLTLNSSPFTTLFKKIGGTQTLTTAGITIRTNFTVSGSGTFNLVGALVMAPPSGQGLTITDCSFNTGGYNVTTTSLQLTGSAARTANLGASVITLTDTSGTLFTVGSNLTINAGTSKIKVQPSGAATAITLGLGTSFTYNDLEFALASAPGVTVTVNGTGVTLNNIIGTQSVAATIKFQGGQTFEITGGFTLSGQSGAVVALTSTTTVQFVMRKPGPWKVGANSTDSGNNAGLQFVAGHSDYLNVSYLNGVDKTAGGGLFFGSNF